MAIRACVSEITHPPTQATIRAAALAAAKTFRSCDVQIWRIGTLLSMSSADDATLNVFRILTMSLPIVFVSSVSPDWLKMKNPAAPAVKREAEEQLGGICENPAGSRLIISS